MIVEAILSFVGLSVPAGVPAWGMMIAGARNYMYQAPWGIVLPIIAAYRKYYGWRFTVRITALMFLTMVVAALIVDLLFGALDLIPANRPSRAEIFGSIELDYKLVLNLIALAVFAVLIYLTHHRGAIDPVCGMKVDRAKAVRLDHGGRAHYFRP